MKKLFNFIPLVFALILIGAGCASSNQSANQNNVSEAKVVVVAPKSEELAIENKGLPEFSADNNIPNTVTSQEETIREKLTEILKLEEDGKDSTKLERANTLLNNFIQEYPDYSDAYFLRALNNAIRGSTDYKNIIGDVDTAIQKKASTVKKYTIIFDSPNLLASTPFFGHFFSFQTDAR